MLKQQTDTYVLSNTVFCLVIFPNKFFQSLIQTFRFDRFGKMGIHADLQGSLDILIECICGHGYYRYDCGIRPVKRTYRFCRSQSVHLRHAHIHKDCIIKATLKEIPENKIVVAVFNPMQQGALKAVCKRLRKINGNYWFFSDEPGGICFPAEKEKIVWTGVVLRKICEL